MKVSENELFAIELILRDPELVVFLVSISLVAYSLHIVSKAISRSDKP